MTSFIDEKVISGIGITTWLLNKADSNTIMSPNGLAIFLDATIQTNDGQ